MKDNTRLSIITINYNNSEGLEKTIKSIISQSYSNYEYIVIDGGSTDGSLEVLKKYSSHIDICISEPDSGVYNAMNKGILKASGEYVIFINSGDLLYKTDVLSNVFADAPDVDLIYGDLQRVFPDKKTDIVYMPETLSLYFLFYETLSHPTTFIRRNLFLKYGLYREDLKIVSDWAFFLKLIFFTNTSRVHLPIIISSFMMDGISSTHQDLVVEERTKVIQETFSNELLDVLGLYPYYESFYNLKGIKIIRSFKRFISNLFSPKAWIDYVYNKRIHSIINLLNKEVRQQHQDPYSIPIIIINFNRLIDLERLISFLQMKGHKRIIIVDNNSTYKPLLEYYEQIQDTVIVERMGQNYGHLVFWKRQDIFEKYSKGYYVVTDSDIYPNEDLPDDYMGRLMKLLDTNKNISKVGFALDISDIPDSYVLKEKVLRWESQHWKNKIDESLYLADIDTTFALYPPMVNPLKNKHLFFKGIRVSGPFLSKHMGWYVDSSAPSEEQIYYKKHANSSNNW